jgi:dihydrofolate reductase
MTISIVVAVGQQGEIGAKGDLLWRLPRDMQYFRETTMGHHVLMGRVTYESIPPRFRPLLGRVNLVVSSTMTATDGLVVLPSIDEALVHAKLAGEQELMVIGGAKVYEQILPIADRVYLTRVHHSFAEADAYFPELGIAWAERHSTHYPADAHNPYDMTFEVWER